MSLLALSAPERAQLGTELRDIPYFQNQTQWLRFREQLVVKSARRNPGFFDPALAAYTPGETEALLDHPTIRAWHQSLRTFQVPDGYAGLMLVPCAASKPWRDHPNMRKSKLYQAYNRLIERMEIGELPRLYLLTVSEPLGIVPQDRWNDFPPYDNPGLFKDDFLRTGMVKTEWATTPWRTRQRLPFDDAAYERCIQRLAAVIQTVLTNNPLPVISFVDDLAQVTTHAHMLNLADPDHRIHRETKRTEPRVDPTESLVERIKAWEAVKQDSPSPRSRRRPR
jgi:hypothetical protein